MISVVLKRYSPTLKSVLPRIKRKGKSLYTCIQNLSTAHFPLYHRLSPLLRGLLQRGPPEGFFKGTSSGVLLAVGADAAGVLLRLTLVVEVVGVVVAGVRVSTTIGMARRKEGSRYLVPEGFAQGVLAGALSVGLLREEVWLA